MRISLLPSSDRTYEELKPLDESTYCKNHRASSDRTYEELKPAEMNLDFDGDTYSSDRTYEELKHLIILVSPKILLWF